MHTSSSLLRLLTLFFALTTLPVSAQTYIVRADRMLDVTSGQIIEPTVVVIEDNKISSVNPDSVPEGENIDLGDMTLLPGLTDMHTHLTGDLEGDWVHRAVKEGAADAALRGARNAKITLLAGFTTVRDLGSSYFSDVSLMKAIDQGFVDGPRIYPSGHALGITGGHCDVTGFAPGILEIGTRGGIADGVDEVIKAVRYQIKHGAKVIKICATAGVLSFEEAVGAQQYSAEEMRAIVDEAARHGVKVAAHAHGTDGIIAAAEAGITSIEHGSILNKKAIAVMKKHGTYLVPTTYLADSIDLDVLPPAIREKAEFVLPLAKEGLSRAIKAKVKIAFGTDAAVYPHGDNAKEFAALVERGMTPLEAIRTATIHAADLLGVVDRGQIKTGLLADIIAVPGDPLKNIEVLENVGFVMKNGKVYKQP
jgi:imidazolonepropionase-like amidohydrolase